MDRNQYAILRIKKKREENNDSRSYIELSKSTIIQNVIHLDYFAECPNITHHIPTNNMENTSIAHPEYGFGHHQTAAVAAVA